ncbi:orotidine-5'-phosphate decarboxylase [Blastomyces dermatitidis ER-3]|uniref:Orotidine-5'-phosphate decarboxylase n=1 Tax=Ajellomyces dermatitidis (strain ER-3 / ATCC MYA-2586) TaxID=559297 RepID=A0ABP2F1M5_AJEDR|nr:orotidine-5'-phosphate decarboxylase [Blastomyces dermatitidis ER-3]EEQ89692.2 orotidine-5'-phosphate decarboxylase [Blastomyces dermatitidis ER-3]
MDPQAQDASSNSITSYLRLLRRCKTTLPYGHLICVSASPNISTMAALLRLARAVGPFIAVLQVHADIIDDWSQDAVRRLFCVAKKYGFLIWEGGRVLNVQKRSGKHQGMSSEEINRDINLARKRYTKGLVGVAAWAGMVSTWVMGPEEQGKGGDRLVPTLRRAAREAVAVLKKSVRTEISGGNKQRDACDNDGEDSSGGCVDDEDDECLGSDDKLGDNLSTMFPSPRKGSVISLTRTITQHTELSTSELFAGVVGPCSDDEEQTNAGNAPTSLPLPPPPLHARGLVLCLPATDDPSFCHEYRRASIATAEAHSDFVVGFVSNESWIEASQTSTIIGSRSNSHEDDADSEEGEDGKGSSEPPYVLFAPLESDHILFPGSESITPPAMDEVTQAHADSVQVYVNVNDDAAGEPSQQRCSNFPLSLHQADTSEVQHRQINTLHQLIGRAISIRNAKASVNHQRQDSEEGDAELLCIPIISMNA